MRRLRRECLLDLEMFLVMFLELFLEVRLCHRGKRARVLWIDDSAPLFS